MISFKVVVKLILILYENIYRQRETFYVQKQSFYTCLHFTYIQNGLIKSESELTYGLNGLSLTQNVLHIQNMKSFFV